jgi:hypothetical protein
MNSENTTDNLEININQPSSPLVPLNIYNSIKEINIPVEIKIETIHKDIMRGGGGENTNTDNSIFGYFKSFFQGFSQQSVQKKKHDTQNKSYLNSLFYSGNEEKKEPEIKEVVILQPETKEEESKEVVILQPETKEEESETKENENIEITKIILTTEDPEMVLRESLKGTKLYYLAERKDLPSQWV